MATVRDILVGRTLKMQTIAPGGTVLEAAEKMNAQKIGSLAVLEGGELIGILTERDLLTRVIAGRRDPAATLVRDVMTANVICCTRDSSLDELSDTMKAKKVRHLPVVDDDRKLIGMISIGDLNSYAAYERELRIHEMEDYIQGRT